ncbi:MAG: FAD-dependent oxidoreductase [Terriglobia bacterium]
MKKGRREFVKSLAGAAVIAPGAAASRFPQGPTMETAKPYDIAVIGAGVFGAWSAYHLQRAGKKVALVDAYGPANSRASSGGESRIIRMGYGPNELYTRWSIRSLELWKGFFARAGKPLFHRTGVFWMMHEGDQYSLDSLAMLQKLKVPHQRLTRPELEKTYPQIDFGTVAWGILEPESGALMARRAVQAVVDEVVRNGGEYRVGAITQPRGQKSVAMVTTGTGETISAGIYIFACGPWLPKIFPDLLGGRIRPTRQEVFFFGIPPGDKRFSPPAMPVWIDLTNEYYGFPDLESRGFKIALDRHGPPHDPDSTNRVVSPEQLREVREILGKRFPGLKDAPVVETRVCQYENTSNGDFLIDRHPDFDNVWLVGGGSGHGFKHGPALGEYVARLVTQGATTEHRFSLATKEKVDARSVF